MLKSYWKTAIRFAAKEQDVWVYQYLSGSRPARFAVFISCYMCRTNTATTGTMRMRTMFIGSTGSTKCLRREKNTRLAITAMPVGPNMKHDFPEVLQFTRVIPFIGVDKHLISYGEKHLWIKDAYIVDSTFFEVFTYRSVRGDLRTALDKPNTAVLLKPLADALFGNVDPIGKTITLDNTVQNKVDYTVLRR
jgi:putative ABC transport system permease protein